MADQIPGTVNGTPVVWNNVLLSIDGETDIPLNGYLTDISWTTGTQTEHVQTMNPLAQPITTNSINSSPRCNFTFAPAKVDGFVALLGDRFNKFTLMLNYYVTGHMDQGTQTVLIQQAQEDELTGSAGAMKAANMGSISYKAVFIGYV